MSRRQNQAQQPTPLQLVPPLQSVPYQGQQSGYIQMPAPPQVIPQAQADNGTTTAIAAIVALVIGIGGAWSVADFFYSGDRIRAIEAQNQQLQQSLQSIDSRLATAQGAICR